MMRFALALAALIVAALGTPAQADVTARYAGTGKYAPSLIFAVADNGQVRAETIRLNQPEERAILITRGGVGYVSAADAQGRFVGRQDDLLVVAGEVMRAAVPPDARTAMRHLAAMRFEIVEGGMETVGGRRGRLYRVTPVMAPVGPVVAPEGNVGPAGPHGHDFDGPEADEENATPPAFEVVISDDPELAPIGREMARLFDSGSVLLEALFGTMPGAVGQVRQLLARGTLIRLSDEVRLGGVDRAVIPQSAFDLPGRVLTRAQLRARAPQMQSRPD
jgi:hypothetical protein